MHTHTFRAMGCSMSVVVDSDRHDVEAALTQVPSWFAEWEACLSRFRADSELSQLNRSAGYWFTPTQTLWDVLQAARAGVTLSGGLVTPTIAAALELAGYDQPFDTLLANGAISGGAALPGSTMLQWDAIEFDDDARDLRLPAGMRLDLGGVAKGWAAERAAEMLADIGAVIVNAGGDLALRRSRADLQPWPVGVADPRASLGVAESAEHLDVLMLENCGVATSGLDHRRWTRADGAPQHHIIDPRTGLPTDSDVLSVTAIAPTAAEAEVAAKTALLLGSRAGVAWIDAQEDYAAIVVLRNGVLLRSARYPALTWATYWQRTQSKHL
jgi:FAD:protein FMN transferase